MRLPVGVSTNVAQLRSWIDATMAKLLAPVTGIWTSTWTGRGERGQDCDRGREREREEDATLMQSSILGAHGCKAWLQLGTCGWQDWPTPSIPSCS